MTFVDSHCHLYADQFNDDRNEVLLSAKKLGVDKILLPNIDLDSVDIMRNLMEQHPDTCYGMMGLHPCSVQENYREILIQIKELLDKNTDRYIGIGEIGIDLYWDKSYLTQQKETFLTQCKWALDLNLPIAIHVRDSFTELFSCLDELNAPELKGVFHCFSGNREEAKKALTYPNFYLGIGGVVTFKNSKLAEVLSHEVPLEKLLLETDSPYLSPHPHRGKRNSPEYIPLIAEKLASTYNVSIEDIAAISTQNALDLFPKINQNV